MRVIAGSAKGRTLVAPRGGGTRPATDRIRETLFAILEPDLIDARVLDLFAGAGTLGIEALSRGAAYVTFVERSPDALAALRKNLAATGFTDQSEVVSQDVAGFLRRRPIAAYDIAFCDPPFADTATLELVLEGFRDALTRDAIVVVRVHKKHLPTVPATARTLRAKEIGEETLLFLRYDGAGGGG